MTKKKGVKELWEKVFCSDSEEFVKMYFDRVYRDENTFVKEADNTIVSAVQLIPYCMTYYGSVIKTGYISGASTLPAFEGRHLMTSLMSETINAAYERGDTLMILIPANDGLISFYKRFGFTPVFSKNETVFHLSDRNECILKKFNIDNSKVFYKYFSRKMSERKNCIQHSYDDFLNICSDADMMVFALESGANICAIAHCAKTERGVIVKELLYDEDVSKETLLNKLCKTFNLQQIIYRDYYSTRYGCEYGMGRIINVRNILSVFAVNNKDLNLAFKVYDEIIEANNSCYKIYNGKVEIVNDNDISDCKRIKIEDLMKFIRKHNIDTSPGDPFYMSLMLE